MQYKCGASSSTCVLPPLHTKYVAYVTCVTKSTAAHVLELMIFKHGLSTDWQAWRETNDRQPLSTCPKTPTPSKVASSNPQFKWEKIGGNHRVGGTFGCEPQGKKHQNCNKPKKPLGKKCFYGCHTVCMPYWQHRCVTAQECNVEAVIECMPWWQHPFEATEESRAANGRMQTQTQAKVRKCAKCAYRRLMLKPS